MIYPLIYSLENLDYIPVQYEKIDKNMDLDVPYCCSFSYGNCNCIDNNYSKRVDGIFNDYFIKKLKEEYIVLNGCLMK